MGKKILEGQINEGATNKHVLCTKSEEVGTIQVKSTNQRALLLQCQEKIY